MATSHLSLKPLEISSQIKHDTQKLTQIQTSLGDLTKELLNKDIDMVETETNKIKNFANGIISIIQKLKLSKQDCSNTISQLQKQVLDLNEKIQMYERNFKSNNKQTDFKRQIEISQKKYLALWEKRIQTASKINTEALAKISIEDRKSKANQVFKWIIVSIYGEPQTKFYWPNFKQQVFLRDNGEDFRTRMGKINPSTAREEQKVKTSDFLAAYNQIASCKQLRKVQNQLEQIKQVAQIFLQCYELAQNVRNLQKQIEKSRQQSRQKDEQAMRWKARTEALEDRIKTNKDYLEVLKRMQQMLGNKIPSYTQKQNTAAQIIQKLKENGSISTIDINIDNQARENCECRIF